MADCCNHFSFTDDGDSFESWQGLRGPYYIPHISADGVLSWTNTGNLPNPAPVDISGPPGSSVELRGPVPSVEDLPATASSSELWLVGTASPYDGWFYNGASWENAGQISVGPVGPAGEDGVSPEISVTDITGGHRVTITDAGGTETFDVLDGTDGAPGSPGAPGADGVSPEISVTDITGGHRITITDATGTKTFDVMDGTDGQPGQTGPAGPGVPAGGTAGQVLAKTGPADYVTGWQDPSGGDVTADMLGIVINGNSTPVGASAEQYVIVKNSTISGITDGLYTAAQAIPANTAIDSTYLTAISDGGLNAVKREAEWTLLWTNANPQNQFAAQTISLDLTGYRSILLIWNHSTGNQRTYSAICFVGDEAQIIRDDVAAKAVYVAYRRFVISISGVSFTDATEGSTVRDNNTNNNTCIPLRIYGIRS